MNVVVKCHDLFQCLLVHSIVYLAAVSPLHCLPCSCLSLVEITYVFLIVIAVLHVLLKVIDPNEFAKIPGISQLLSGLIPYTGNAHLSWV